MDLLLLWFLGQGVNTGFIQVIPRVCSVLQYLRVRAHFYTQLLCVPILNHNSTLPNTNFCPFLQDSIMQETGYDPCDNPNGQKMALKQRRQPSSSRENFQGWKSIQTEVEQISCMQAHELVPGSGQRPCPVSSRGLVCGNSENQNFKIFWTKIRNASRVMRVILAQGPC